MKVANPCRAGTASKVEVAEGQAMFYAGFEKSNIEKSVVDPRFAWTLSWTQGTHYIHFQFNTRCLEIRDAENSETGAPHSKCPILNFWTSCLLNHIQEIRMYDTGSAGLYIPCFLFALLISRTEQCLQLNPTSLLVLNPYFQGSNRRGQRISSLSSSSSADDIITGSGIAPQTPGDTSVEQGDGDKPPAPDSNSGSASTVPGEEEALGNPNEVVFDDVNGMYKFRRRFRPWKISKT